MTNFRTLYKVPVAFWIALAGALSLHIGIRYLLMQKGFVSVSADEFARGIRSANWAAEPTFTLQHFTNPWLPLEMYLNGFLMRLWPNPFWIPRLTVFVASLSTLLSFVWLSYTLFKSYTVAVIQAYLLVTFHWFAWLSATPMLEMYYLPFYIMGLVFLLRFVQGHSDKSWLYSGLSLAFATGIHVQSWLIVAITLICTLPFSIGVLFKSKFRAFGKWVGLYVSAVSIVAFSVVAQWQVQGSALGFLGKHTAYSRWFYDGYDVSVVEKFLYYIRIVFGEMPIVVWPLVFLGFWLVLQEDDINRKGFPLVLSVVLLLVFGYSNVNSGPPSAAPGRYSLLHVGILFLYASHGLWRCVSGRGRNGWRRKIGSFGLAGLILGILITSQYGRIFDFPRGMPVEAVMAGSAVSDLIEQNGAGNVLIELDYWAFLGVQMMANAGADVQFDRPGSSTERDLPSDLLLSDVIAEKYFEENDIRYAVFRSEELTTMLEGDGFPILWRGGEWRVFGSEKQ